MPLNQEKMLLWARIWFPMWICFFRREIDCMFHLPSFAFPNRIILILIIPLVAPNLIQIYFSLWVTLHCCSQDATVIQSYFFLQEAASHVVILVLIVCNTWQWLKKGSHTFCFRLPRSLFAIFLPASSKSVFTSWL